MIKIKTRKEALIELRNRIFDRKLANEMDIVYFNERAKKMKNNTQEKIDTLRIVSDRTTAVKNDEEYLEVLDKNLK